MKNTNTKRSKVNIIFSSFIIIGYIVCTYFFSSLASQVSGTFVLHDESRRGQAG